MSADFSFALSDGQDSHADSSEARYLESGPALSLGQGFAQPPDVTGVPSPLRVPILPEVSFEQSADDDDICSLSSGLSPRHTEANSARRQGCEDTQASISALARYASEYGRAVGEHTSGNVPPCGSRADELMIGILAQQLKQLAGMSVQVHTAVTCSARAVERMAVLKAAQLLRQAFWSWQCFREQQCAKRRQLQRASQRLERSRLLRMWYAWRVDFPRRDRSHAMLGKARRVLNRGKLGRVVGAWQALIEERWWRLQISTRDHEIQHLTQQADNMHKRGIQLLRRRSHGAVLSAWARAAHARTAQRLLEVRLEGAHKQRLLSHALRAWRNVAEAAACKRRSAAHCSYVLQRLYMQRALSKWRTQAVQRQDKAALLGAYAEQGAQMHREKLQGSILRQWQAEAIMQAYCRRAQERLKAHMLRSILQGWWSRMDQWKRVQQFAEASARRAEDVQACMWEAAFEEWRILALSATCTKLRTRQEQLEKRMAPAQQELQQLRRDNERFKRIIDEDTSLMRSADLLRTVQELQGAIAHTNTPPSTGMTVTAVKRASVAAPPSSPHLKSPALEALKGRRGRISANSVFAPAY
ncbi:hypothetical protein WJX73_000462 [Symbiochloris irregularis]|uniref:Uncharacterized protein n=1 Tax=Symbiochloris irregularis TaxID=706552 RepID=A0AAW1NZV6_9CHLO